MTTTGSFVAWAHNVVIMVVVPALVIVASGAGVVVVRRPSIVVFLHGGDNVWGWAIARHGRYVPLE